MLQNLEAHNWSGSSILKSNPSFILMRYQAVPFSMWFNFKNFTEHWHQVSRQARDHMHCWMKASCMNTCDYVQNFENVCVMTTLTVCKHYMNEHCAFWITTAKQSWDKTRTICANQTAIPRLYWPTLEDLARTVFVYLWDSTDKHTLTKIFSSVFFHLN